MKVGLFFGSFNPVHIGHLIIANYLAESSDLDELWMVLTPHNPHKKRESLADDYIRMDMLEAALKKQPNLKACDIELFLPKPSYTVDTLAHLKERYPNNDFVLIMGGDNLKSLSKWKNYEVILKNHEVYVYKRPNYELGELEGHSAIQIFDKAPVMQISSSFIRKLIREQKSIKYWVVDEVEEIIDKNALYL